MTCDIYVILCHILWHFVTVMYDIILTSNIKFENKKIDKNKNKNKLSSLFSTLILSPLQGFSSRETDFYFCQFLSNFFKYLSSNFLSSYLYNIFVIYFLSNSSLLKSLSSTIFNFSFLLTFILSLLSNFITANRGQVEKRLF